MDMDEILARLLRQAEGGGAVPGGAMPGGSSVGGAAEMRALVEEASELGARRALARLGLADEAARDDVSELRELLGAWRDAKRSAWKAAIDWTVRGALALILVALAVRFGLSGVLK